MAVKIRNKLWENSQQFLQPGEQVQAIIPSQKLSGWWGLLTYLFAFWNRYMVIIATDQRIVVLDCGKWTMGTPKSVLTQGQRNTRIGPPTGLWWKCTSLGKPMYVNKRFHKDVVAADAAIGL